MSIYEEKTAKTSSTIIFIVLAFIIIYPLWLLGDRELHWSEGFYAVEAMEINYWWPVAKAHGIMQPNSFPLFPWLVKLLTELTGLSITFILRVIVIITLAGLVALVWHSARRAAGTTAAAVAAAVMMSTNIIFEKSLDGYPETLGMLFLMTAWLLWFYIGTMKNNWSLAWIAGFLFCGLAFYTIGWQAIILFTVPLIFMRRPLTIWSKLSTPGFFAGLVVLAGFIILWLLPYLQTTQSLSFLSFPSTTWLNYLSHLLTFPFEVLFRFSPWSIIAWAPFCVALIPLDKTPVFSRFLRTIAYSLFFLTWINPANDSRNIIFLVPPVAILSGIYYWIMIKRYGRQFQQLMKYLPIVAITIGTIILAIYLLPTMWWAKIISSKHGMQFTDNSKYLYLSIFYGTLSCGIGLLLCFRIGKTRIWEFILLLTICVTTFFWAVMLPYRAQNNSKKRLGREIKTVLEANNAPHNMKIYKSEIVDLYGECYYSGYQVQRIITLSDINDDEPVIYLLSMGFPEMPGRRWSDLFPANKKYRGKTLRLMKGEKIATTNNHSPRTKK
jgi:4-amino-4-deoxy-L-arabinose transferase-like glycosyltransferase